MRNLTDYLSVREIIQLKHSEITGIQKCKKCKRDLVHAYEEDYETNIIFCRYCNIIYSDMDDIGLVKKIEDENEAEKRKGKP